MTQTVADRIGAAGKIMIFGQVAELARVNLRNIPRPDRRVWLSLTRRLLDFIQRSRGNGGQPA
ncbi:MAG TPA: hypothetical protein VHY31_25390 [Streptosporangiaceae bacterium]|jgi:hypothetical protein|nr:hypothetical protein [Streptosporangiaceae bacterium]